MLDDTIRFLQERDADAYAGYLRDLKRELQEPREIVLHDADLHALGSGRGCVIRDGVAVYYD
jgi:hypothetical protein